MATFKVEVKNIGRLLSDFEQYGKRAEDAVWFGLERTAFEVRDHAVTNVAKVTSTLARSIQITDRDRESLRLAVSTNLEYARIQELGFSGIQNVRGHNRTMIQAFGRPFVKTVAVSAHTRNVIRRPRPYMEPAAQFGQRRVTQNITRELEALEL